MLNQFGNWVNENPGGWGWFKPKTPFWHAIKLLTLPLVFSLWLVTWWVCFLLYTALISIDYIFSGEE